MGDDYHKTGLYRWQRQAKPSRVQSRSQKVTTTNDIQHWLQKVEDASTKAAEAVLGPYTIGRHRGQAQIRGVSDQARIQDEAYTEAHDLLSEWLTQKVSDNDLDPDLEGGDPVPDPWRKEDLGSKARREWDNLLNGNLEELGMDTSVPLARRQQEDDPYANLYDLDEGEAVSTVIKTMMSKDLVKKRFRQDLGFDDPLKGEDPRTKMALRHQRVKENREKREEELKRRRREQDMKKEARLTAQQIVMKEQKEKEMKMRKEEQKIKQQMAQIRKEMHHSRRKQQEEEETARLAREELERQEVRETEEMLRTEHEASQRKMAEMTQRQLQKAKQAAENLRTLHRLFTAWYDIVLYRRLCFGKARAMADWRLTLRVWNAWRSHTRSQRVTLETKQHQMNVVDENRKSVKAQRHHYLQQLRRHFQAWRDFVGQEQDKRELERAQETTRSKMMTLLTAVTQEAMKTGRQDRNTAQDKTSNHPPPRGPPRMAWGGDDQSDASSLPPSSSRPDSALSSVSTTQGRGQGHQGQRAPSQGWQITRKHAQLSKEELARFMEHGDPQDVEDGGGSEVSAGSSTQHSDTKIRRRFGTQPWMNRHYVVNNLEHRFSAQQKLLKEQQSALKQQHKMIQELTFAQSQQQHQQTLTQINAAVTAGTPLPQDIAVSARDCEGSGEDRHKRKKSEDRPAGSGTSSPSAPSATTKVTHRGPDTHRSEVSSLVSEASPSEVTSASSATTGTQNTKYLRVLKNMEDRAAERARLKAERDEKRRKAEEERMEKLKAQEEELKKQAEEEKQARVQAYREKKRLEKQKEQERQREAERQRELNVMADVHYQRALMKFKVLLPMKKMVTMAHEKIDTACHHHDHLILRKVIVVWKQHTDELTAEKKQLADDLHGYIVVRRCFQSWKNFKYRMLFMERRAERHHRDTLLPKLMEAWRQYTLQEKQEEVLRMQQALDFYPRSLVKKVFHAWRRLPQELKREAEREKRKAEMRKKVADMLPDFTPSSSSSPQVLRSTDSTKWP